MLRSREDKITRSRIDNVLFSAYGPNEISSLSVKELSNPNTFDALGHPQHGGLYDPSLGPTEFRDQCITCNLSTDDCPGHLGHIRLPVVVFNPVLFDTLYQILRSTCFNCHRLTVKPHKAKIFQHQIQLISEGYAGETFYFASNAILAFSKDPQYFDNYLKALIHEIRQKTRCSLLASSQTKEIVDSLRDSFIRQELLSASTSPPPCPHCAFPRMRFRKEPNQLGRIYVTIPSRRKRAAPPRVKSEIADLEEPPPRQETTIPRRKRAPPRGVKSEIVNQEELPPKQETEDKPDIPRTESTFLKSLLESDERAVLTSTEAHFHVRELSKTDGRLLSDVFPVLLDAKENNGCPTDIFFTNSCLVPPSRFRPLLHVGDRKFENAQTTAYSKVLKNSVALRELLTKPKTEGTEVTPTADEDKTGEASDPPISTGETFLTFWQNLQRTVGGIYDQDLDKDKGDSLPGIRQIIEKKEGIFRKHMMGKRVDFACRSVLSPDFNILKTEVGIPLVFASKLTYPHSVTYFSYAMLYKAVVNGPLVYPGATHVEYEDGRVVILPPNDKNRRVAIADGLMDQPLTMKPRFWPKKVYRHIQDGDVVYVNRQPTLHRPSLQAHRVKVLPREKTLRLHYSCCKAYNADFDGDEMNVHLPQNELARAEGYCIASTTQNYLAPKDSSPLGGLFQDHMIAGVLLTLRGRFYNKKDYQQLAGHGLLNTDGMLKLLPPCILKPTELWSGKQVISTVILNILPSSKKPLSLTGKIKIPCKAWLTDRYRVPSPCEDPSVKGLHMCESELVIRQGELLSGVLDKSQCGPSLFGVVHSCYELYGGDVSGKLITALARVLTAFLQMRGFTLGVEDIVCNREPDAKRYGLMKEILRCGPDVTRSVIGQHLTGSIRGCIQQLQFGGEMEASLMMDLDLAVKKKTDEYQNLISKSTVPVGLLKRFPSNNLQLMVVAGAKGSTVNTMQISSLVGQVELEGKRSPLMLSGKSLVSFGPYDPSPRARGFVCNRFMTGLRPQEFFFHTMAGREGLVDTACKTSRSGYMQRCLIKHMEGVVTSYDTTVRDADRSVIQFLYGEDGMDVLKVKPLAASRFPLLIRNKDNVLSDPTTNDIVEKCDLDTATLLQCEVEAKVAAADGNARLIPDPVVSQLGNAARYFGCLSEKLYGELREYIQTDPHDLVVPDGSTSDDDTVDPPTLRMLISLRTIKANVSPGEAVGIVAAQSIGEPSTQMTLNTFHFAGRGEMNVTLGVPRLREILMVSGHGKTPTMTIPLLKTDTAKIRAKEIEKKMTRVLLKDVLANVSVTQRVSISTGGVSEGRQCQIRFQLLKHKAYKHKFTVSPRLVLSYMERHFFKHLIGEIVSTLKSMGQTSLLQENKKSERRMPKAVSLEEVAEDLSDVEAGDEGDAMNSRIVNRALDAQDYEGEDEERADVDPVTDDEDVIELDDDDSADKAPTKKEAPTDDDGEGNLNFRKPKKQRQMDESRIKSVLAIKTLGGPEMLGYSYDAKRELWCELRLQIPSNEMIDFDSMLEKAANNCVVHTVPGISRGVVSEQRDGSSVLNTQGINIPQAHAHLDVLDVNRLYSNDILTVAEKYGIEAAYQTIIKELQTTFSAYGIGVDFRHLSLIADYMTRDGSLKPFNRLSMGINPSPMQRMSFETSIPFLKHAVISGQLDDLRSPSSSIAVGQPFRCGTNMIDTLLPLHVS